MGKLKPHQFTRDEIVALRVVAQIIQFARLPQNEAEIQLLSPRGNEYIPYRKFADMLSSERASFSLSQLIRYENAGIFSEKNGNYQTINDDYLAAIAPRTPYTAGQLAAALHLDYLNWPVDPIQKLMQAKIGQKDLMKLLKKWRISEDEWFDAEKGLLSKDCVSPLAGLLGVSEDYLLKSAIIQLADRLQREVDSELAADFSEESEFEPSGEVDLVCTTLTGYYRQTLSKHNFQLSRKRDYERFCRMLGVRPESDVALRLKEIALERIATEQEELDVAAPICELENLTPGTLLKRLKAECDSAAC